jgi:Kinesin motor domain
MEVSDLTPKLTNRMHPDVLLRLRASNSKSNEMITMLDKSSHTLSVTSSLGNKTYLFTDVFDTETNTEIYNKSIRLLVKDCCDGYNVSVVALGSSRSGKSSTVHGMDDMGLVPLIAQGLLTKGDIAAALQFGFEDASDCKITLQVIEVYGEMIRDLLNPFSMTENYKIVEDVKNGVVVDGLTNVTIKAANDILPIINQILKAKMPETGRKSNVIYKFSVSQAGTKSFFTVVDFSSSEYYFQDPNKIILSEGVLVGSSALGPYRLIDRMGKLNATKQVEGSNSIMTKLLAEEIGGNCKVKFIFHFDCNDASKPNIQSLRLAETLRLIKYHPVISNNDFLMALQRQRVFISYSGANPKSE